MNILDSLILFETAKLAKEKGFDWNTDYYYRSDCKVYSALYYDSTPNNLTIVDDWMSGDSENKVTKVCTAPTQSLLQKWLREVHNIDITIMIRFANTYGVYIHQNKNIPKGFEEIIIKVTWENHKRLYEESLEIGLQESLKLI